MVGVSKSGVSRLETGESFPANINVAQVLHALNVRGSEFAQIMALANEIHQPNWLATDAPRLPQQLRTLIDYEQTAEAITSVNLTAFPGLLQTSDYARAILATENATAKELELRLKVRQQRQAVLNDRVQLVAIVDESVLGRAIGGREVAAGQLRHVLVMSRQGNVEVRVIPFDDVDAVTELARFNSGYLLYEFAKLSPVAYVELPPLGGTFFDQKHIVGRLIHMSTRLRALALSPAESAGLIEQSIVNLESP